MPLRALHLAEGSDSAKTLLSFREAGIEPVVINSERRKSFEVIEASGTTTPVAYNLHARLDLPASKYTRYSFCWLPQLGGAALRVRGVGREIDALVRESAPDFVFAHWGTGVAPEVTLLRRCRALRDVPLILNMESFPTAWQPGARQRFERGILARIAPLVDGMVIPTPEMAELIDSVAPELLRRPHLIAPFYYPAAFTRGADPPSIPAAEGDGVVFTGWLDFSRALNDVRGQLLELARAGLHVHCSQVPGMDHPRVSLFKRFGVRAFTSGELASFMRRFAASLVTFNLGDRGEHAQRFGTSLPARFLFSLAVGIPVLLPGGRFPPMERMVREHDLGFVYASPEEARERLSSPDWPDVQRHVYASRERFRFHPEPFLAFVRRVLTARRGSAS